MNSNIAPYDSKALSDLKFLFEPVKVYKLKYIKKNGEAVYYINRQIYKGKEHRNMTTDEIDFVNTHSAPQIAKHFGKSTSWAYARKSGKYVI